jgi:predicted transcriptional regulator
MLPSSLGAPKGTVTWEDLPYKGGVKLYRTESFGLQDGAEWWTTNPNKIPRGEPTTFLTVPVEALKDYATMGRGGIDEFVFPDLKPNQLTQYGMDTAFTEPHAQVPTAIAQLPNGVSLYEHGVQYGDSRFTLGNDFIYLHPNEAYSSGLTVLRGNLKPEQAGELPAQHIGNVAGFGDLPPVVANALREYVNDPSLTSETLLRAIQDDELADHEPPDVGDVNAENLDLVTIPSGKSSKVTQQVPRYWYHSLRGRALGKDGSIQPYETRNETAILRDELYRDPKPTGFVFLSPTPFSGDSYKIDVSKLDTSLMRLTGQAEGYAVYGGPIPKDAIVEAPTPKTLLQRIREKSLQRVGGNRPRSLARKVEEPVTEPTSTKSIGECFSYAWKKVASDPESKLIHGTVTDPWSGKSYPHAWVEKDGIVYDWQTMEVGTSKYGKKGWPVKEFYEAFTPTNVRAYTHSEALQKGVAEKQYGPWDTDAPEVQTSAETPPAPKAVRERAKLPQGDFARYDETTRQQQFFRVVAPEVVAADKGKLLNLFKPDSVFPLSPYKLDNVYRDLRSVAAAFGIVEPKPLDENGKVIKNPDINQEISHHSTPAWKAYEREVHTRYHHAVNAGLKSGELSTVHAINYAGNPKRGYPVIAKTESVPAIKEAFLKEENKSYRDITKGASKKETAELREARPNMASIRSFTGPKAVSDYETPPAPQTLAERIREKSLQRVEGERSRQFPRKVEETRALKGNPPAIYIGPSGQTWTGRGQQPRWVKDELASGKTLEDLRAQSNQVDRSNEVTPAEDGRTWGRAIDKAEDVQPEITFRKEINPYKSEGWPSITIELGRDTDGRWMWAGRVYRVDTGKHWLTDNFGLNPKRGNFASSKEEALDMARKEVTAYFEEPGVKNKEAGKEWVKWLNSLTIEDGVKPASASETPVVETPERGYTPPPKELYQPAPTPPENIKGDEAAIKRSMEFNKAAASEDGAEHDLFYKYGTLTPYTSLPEHIRYDFPPGVDVAQLQLAEYMARDMDFLEHELGMPPLRDKPKSAGLSNRGLEDPWWKEYEAYKDLATGRIYNAIGRLIDSGEYTWLKVPYVQGLTDSGTHLVPAEHYDELLQYANDEVNKAKDEVEKYKKKLEEQKEVRGPTLNSQVANRVYDKAVEFVVSEGKVSVSSLQKQFNIGWSTAKNLVGMLEEDGIVSKADEKGNRKVLKEAEAAPPAAPQKDSDVALQLFDKYGPFGYHARHDLDIAFGGKPWANKFLPRTEAVLKELTDSGKIKLSNDGKYLMSAEFADKFDRYRKGKMTEEEELVYEEEVLLGYITSMRDQLSRPFMEGDPRHPYLDIRPYLYHNGSEPANAETRLKATMAEERLMGKGLIQRHPLTNKGIVTAEWAQKIKELHAEKLAEKKAEAASRVVEKAKEDPLLQQALDHIAEKGAALSPLQKALNIGYARAKALVNALEESHHITPADSNGKREILNPKIAEEKPSAAEIKAIRESKARAEAITDIRLYDIAQEDGSLQTYLNGRDKLLRIDMAKALSDQYNMTVPEAYVVMDAIDRVVGPSAPRENVERLPDFHNNTNVDLIKIGKEYGDPKHFFLELESVLWSMKEMLIEGAETNPELRGYAKVFDDDFETGISIDKSYGGIFVKGPASGAFINPFYESGATSLYGVQIAIYKTIIHELAHAGNMYHGQGHDAEIEKIDKFFADSGDRDVYMDDILSALQAHEATFTAMKEAYDRDTTKTAGKPLVANSKDAGAAPSGAAASGSGDESGAVQTGREPGDGGTLVAYSRRPEEGQNGGAGEDNVDLTPPTNEERLRAAESRIKLKSAYREEAEKLDLKRAFYNAQRGMDDYLSKLKTTYQNIWNPSKELLTLMELQPESKVIEYGPNANNLYQIQARMDSMADYYSTGYVQPVVNDLMTNLGYYAKAKGIKLRLAVDTVSEMLKARHADERREEFFIRYRPLKQSVVPGAAGSELGLSPAALRKKLYKQAALVAGDPRFGDKPTRIELLKKISAQLRRIVMDNRNVSPTGYSEHPNRPRDAAGNAITMDTRWSSNLYAAADDTKPNYTATVRDLMHIDLQDPNTGPFLREILRNITRLNEVEKYLRGIGGSWNDHVDEIVNGLYQFKNYVPLKSRFGDLDPIDLEGTRNFGHVAGFVQGMEGGRHTTENTVFQLAYDAFRAAHQASRAGITLRVKNLIDQGFLNGEFVTRVTAAERFMNPELGTMRPEILGGNKIYHMLPDGTAEIYAVHDEPILDGLRRPYGQVSALTKAAAMVTGFMSRQMTLYTPLFAPVNFVKDARTMGHMLPLEYEPGEIGKYEYQLSALQNVMSGKGFTAFKVAKLYRTHRHKELDDLVKTDPFARRVLEWIKHGGPSTHALVMRIQDGYQNLAKLNDPRSISGAIDRVRDYFRIWNDSWDMLARVTAADIVKKVEMQRGKPEEVASEIASYKAKEVSNLSLYGTEGHKVGAWFAFFKPAATTVVKTMEALAPVWRSTEAHIDKVLPPELRQDPEARRIVGERFNRKKAVIKGLIGTLLGLGMLEYALAYLMSDNDEQGRNRIAMDDKGMAVRGARFNIYGTDRFFNLPHGFGLGNLIAMGYQIGALINPADKQDLRSFTSNMGRIIGEMFSPVTISHIDPLKDPWSFIIDTIAPTPIKAGVEYAMNKNSMGNPIFNVHASKLAESMTGGKSVPEFWKEVSKFAYRKFGWDIPPNVLNFLGSNYLSGMSALASMGTEVAMGVASALTNGEHGKDINPKVLLGGFLGNEVNVDANDYYYVKDKVDDLNKAVNTGKIDTEVLTRQITNIPTAQAAVAAFNKNLGTIRGIEQRMKALRADPNLSKNLRDELIEAEQQQLDIQKRLAVDAVAAFGIEP